MAISEIKNIEKLKKKLKDALEENKYLKTCCKKAGKELEKYSFKYDDKEKNLVIQAKHLNELYKESLTRNDNLVELISKL